MSLQRRNNEIWQLREGGRDLDPPTPSDTPSGPPAKKPRMTYIFKFKTNILNEVEKFGRACIQVALLFVTHLRIYGIWKFVYYF